MQLASPGCLEVVVQEAKAVEPTVVKEAETSDPTAGVQMSTAEAVNVVAMPSDYFPAPQVHTVHLEHVILVETLAEMLWGRERDARSLN